MGLHRVEKTERTERAERESPGWRSIPSCRSSPSSTPSPPFHLWIDEVPRPGWANMSIDLALLDRAEHQGESWLRLYRWDPHCLSFGRHEPAVAHYDGDRIRALGLDTVRRPTGGRSVWHARELTYAITSRCSRFGSLRDAYLEIHRLLSHALGSLGIEASLASRRPAVALDAGACFSQPAGGEVLVDGRKVIGSAQLRRGNALLQHGSILLHNDQHSVTGLLRDQPVRTPFVTDPSDPPVLPVQMGELTHAIVSSAKARWPGIWVPATEPGEVMDDAIRHYPLFRAPAWTWAR